MLPANAVLNRLIDPYLTRPWVGPRRAGFRSGWSISVSGTDVGQRTQSGREDRMERRRALPKDRLDRDQFQAACREGGQGVKRTPRTWKIGSKRGRTRCAGQDELPSLRRQRSPLLMGILAYNLLHMLRQFYLMGEEVKRQWTGWPNAWSK